MEQPAALPASEPTPYSPPARFTLAGYKPWGILLVSLVCIILFCGLGTEKPPISQEAFGRWGAPGPVAVWNGAIWGLVTSNFVHQAIWHLGFNLYWFWIFGRKIEFECGWLFTLLLILTAAVVSSAGELAFGGTTGIGLSGVVYAFFGFIFISSKVNARFQQFLTVKDTRYFIGWLFFCVILTWTNVLAVGNAGHFAGLLWGGIVAGLLTTRAAVRYSVGLALLVILSVPGFWAPWSATWLSSKAYGFHVANKLPEAKHYYQLVLQKAAADTAVLHNAQKNLNNILIFELSKQAEKAAIKQDKSRVQQLCQQILQIEPTDEWATAMLRTTTTPVSNH